MITPMEDHATIIRCISTILRAAQGVVDAETHQAIDIGGDVVRIRESADRLRARVAELEDEQRNGNLAAKELYQEAKRLRAALEAAPEPFKRQAEGSWSWDYDDWFHTTRAEALK